nr:ABC transporter ATP-binding protein [uncultured Faecalimonas sp.]
MFQLIPYLKGYKKESVIGPLFKLLEACFELIVPLVMAKIIDVGIENRDMPYILKMGGILVLLGVIGLVCSLTAQYFAAKAAVGFGTELRHDLFRHISTLSYREIDQAGSATLVTRMTSDINQVQSGVNLVLRLFLRSPFIVVGAVAMAFTVNVRLAWIFVVAVPLLSIVIYGIMTITIPIYKKVQRGLDRILLTTRENLAGIRVIRAFRTQKREQQSFERDSQTLMSDQLRVGWISGLMNPLTYLIVNGAIIVLVWAGAFEVDGGLVTQGEMIALVSYMTQILIALVALANLIVSFTKALASAGRINEIFALHTTIESPVSGREDEVTEEKCRRCAEKTGEAVSFTHVFFRYHGSGEPALSDVTFSVKKGETVGIIGGTGSGKSTLVNLIPRFYDVSEGSVLLDGADVRTYQLEKLRAKIGIVPQKATLFCGTIRDNIRWGKKDATDEEIYEALEIAQAKVFVQEKPRELDTMISQGGKNLSGGQRQRLTIARALVRKPEVLILDDSASALDFATDAKLRRALEEKTKDMTVFLVSQRAASILHADKIIVMDDGAVAGIGTHQELLKTCGVYREICYSQLSKEEVERYEA